MSSSKILFIIVALVFILLIGGVIGFLFINKREDVNPDEAIETNEVIIENMEFAPETIKIKVGDTVTWTNEDNTSHIVASDPHPIHTDLSDLESDNLATGETYSFTFDEVGEFTYHCHLHPGMKGAVIVEQN